MSTRYFFTACLIYMLSIGGNAPTAQPALPLAVDTLVEVHQHNFFTQQHAQLMSFADSAAVYAYSRPEFSAYFRQRTLAFRDSVYAFQPWTCEEPLSCMATLNRLRAEGRQIEERFKKISVNISSPDATLLLYTGLVIALVLGAFFLGKRSR